MTNINMKEFSLPGFVRRYPTLIIGLLLTLIIIAQSVFNGSFGQIGPDNDDVMRLIQIRDFLGLGPLEKQSWFDTNQYRLGPENGTDMHWSRLADIPIILLTFIFDFFTTRETALRWAYSIWPPFSALLFILAMAKGAKYWAIVNQSVSRPVINEDKTHFFTLVLLAFFSFNFYRFSPGAIDHHNIQIILIVLSIAISRSFSLCFPLPLRLIPSQSFLHLGSLASPLPYLSP